MPDVATAATSSQICDGASAVLVVSEQALKDHGLTPRARIHHVSVTAGDPVIMLEEPLFATERALKKAGMTIGDIDAYEVNEAFAPVPIAWLKYLGADPERINVHGRSEEHTSELQSLMRISYAVFCLKKNILQKQ